MRPKTTPGQPTGTNPPPEPAKAPNQTVKVGKELVTAARKVAVLRGQTLEEYITTALAGCADEVAAQIADDGALAVRDRSEGLTHLKDKANLGTLNVPGPVATRLASLAGQCLTSVAKLIDPGLRAAVERDLRDAVRNEAAVLRLAFWDAARFTLPVRGRVAAGRPTFSFEDTTEFDFAARLGGDDVFMLRVKGQSMIQSHIAPGDYVVIRRSPSAEPGDVVVALVDGEPTLKKLKRETDRKTGKQVLRLYPCNDGMAPVEFKADRDNIVGVMIAVVRVP